jgi:hypothetical protein
LKIPKSCEYFANILKIPKSCEYFANILKIPESCKYFANTENPANILQIRKCGKPGLLKSSRFRRNNRYNN